MSLTILVDEN